MANLSAPVAIWAGVIVGFLAAKSLGTVIGWMPAVLVGSVLGIAVFVVTLPAVDRRLYGDRSRGGDNA